MDKDFIIASTSGKIDFNIPLEKEIVKSNSNLDRYIGVELGCDEILKKDIFKMALIKDIKIIDNTENFINIKLKDFQIKYNQEDNSIKICL